MRMHLSLLLLFLALPISAADRMKVLIIDGQNNHDWKTTTPRLKQYLEETSLFTVDVATTPPARQSWQAWSEFSPSFSTYQLVVLNYNGESWPDTTNRALEEFVRG